MKTTNGGSETYDGGLSETQPGVSSGAKGRGKNSIFDRPANSSTNNSKANSGDSMGWFEQFDRF
ncbi:MAG: hypothetical protein WCL90_11180, partial [Planctomycetota bacterium]